MHWLTFLLLAQQQELAFQLGALRSPAAAGNTADRTSAAFAVNYSVRLHDKRLYLDVPAIAGPSAQANGPRGGGYASLFVTPGLRVKLAPDQKLDPFVFAGAGYAQFERYQPDSREHRGAFTYGGGVDGRIVKWLAWRAEFRGFAAPGGAHALVSGGLVLRLKQGPS